ncbi:uncharacterized protein LOC144871929 [Branchiostoma floridae x Branchiostoma japonicum]
MKMILDKNDQAAKDKKTIAIGEQGYCLSRLGPRCHLMAVDKFREALGRGSPNYRTSELKIRWNYGLALCLTRYLDKHNFTGDPEFKPTEVYEEAQRCLALVTGSDIQAFCGKGWVTLGEVHSKYNVIDCKYFEGNEKPKGLNNQQIDECFEKGLAVAPDDHFVLERVGRHHRHRKRIDKAIECLERANEVRPSVFSWHHLGKAYKSKAVTEAQCVQSDPNRSYDVDRVQRDIGRVTLDSHDQSEMDVTQTHPQDPFLQKAKHCHVKAYELCEGLAVEISVDLAEILMQMGQHVEALQYFRKAIVKDSASRFLEAANCYQKWGECFLQLGQEENGKNMLRKAVENAAKVNVEKEGAFATLVSLMRRDTSGLQADHANKLAQLYELVKRYREALDFRKTALQLKSNDPTTLRGLVDNLRAQGDYTQARMYLSMLRGLTEVEIPMDEVIEVNLGAAEVQTRQDPNLGRDIFLETFDFVFPAETHPNIMYNVFVYSDEEDRERAEALTILCEEQYDLSCRCVHRDIPCTGSVIEMVADLIDKSTCVIFVISKSSLQKSMVTHTIGLTMKLVNTRGFGNLVTVKVDDCKLPPIISVYPSIKMQDCFTPPGGVNTNLFRKMITIETCQH